MTVLACIDGSRYAVSVCSYAARAALRLGVGVELLHAIDRPLEGGEAIDRSGRMTVDMAEATLEEFARLSEERSRLAQAQGRLILDQAASWVRAAGVETVRERLVFGGLVDNLRDHEFDARLIVVGKRGEAENQAAAHLGSNLERVVRASHHPVLIVPPEQRPLRRFVVAYDGGPSSTKVIDILTQEPLLLDAECHLLMVSAADAEHRSRLAAATARLRDAGYSVNEVMTPGQADKVILATVRDTDADLLVMGAYGHARIRTLIIGSTTTALLRASMVPVLVVR
jgi:nucleotide-binding universal stress UspA family protein